MSKAMKLTKKQKKNLVRIITAILLMAAAEVLTRFIDIGKPLTLLIYVLPFAAAGYDVVFKAVRNIGHGQIFDENLLMSIATVGAFATGEYSEGAAVMIFYQIGELFQNIATVRSRNSVAQLMDIRPDTAAVIRDGQRIEVHPSEVAVGEIIEIRAGDRVPIDCVVISGQSTLDTAALTGESVPRDVTAGQEVLSGCVNINGLLTCKTTKPFGESTASRILELVENASSKKAKAENFITKFARVYTPSVVGAALLLALIPSLIVGEPRKWIMRALTFLVVSCPCALVISIPMSFFGGIGGASRRGILVKGGSYMETLAKAKTVVFDKTGTLTEGRFSVTGIYPADGVSEKQLLTTAAAAESFSTHPIARSLTLETQKRELALPKVSEYKELSGKGISCQIDGAGVLVGNLKLIPENVQTNAGITGTAVYVMYGGKYLGAITVGDEPKKNSQKTVRRLKEMKLEPVMLTGDSQQAAEKTARTLGIEKLHASLLPQDKLDILEGLIADSRGSVVFVGDGINDAPALSRADIGIAMGAAGSDAAIEAADIVLMDDDPEKIVTAIAVSRKTLSIVRGNIIFALGVKLLVLAASALGYANMWWAVFADVGVAAIAILNAMRALNTKKL